MGVGQEDVMDLNNLAEWIDKKICGPCKDGYTCQDFDCEQAQKIAVLLKSMVPFTGQDSEGNHVTGWFAPE